MPDRPEGARRFPAIRLRREHGLLLLFVLVTLGLSLGVQYFATPQNVLRVLRDQAHLAVLAVGMTLVILTGGIDLSVGSAVALAGVSLGLVWKGTGSAPLALLTALGVGGLCGACNGLLVSVGRVPALIVTLATLSVFRGLAFALGGSNAAGRFPHLILAWNRDDLLGLPVPLWLSAALLLGAGIYLARTDGGRAVYAVGANPAAARLSGVPVDLVKLRLYLASGLLAGLAAILYAAQNDSVKADIGVEYELMAITMVVLGGTSVSGGEGSMAGTALGYLTLVFIQNGMNLKSELVLGSLRVPVGSEVHGVVVAFLLIGALLVDAGFRRRVREGAGRDLA
jgi:ribose/xylose/arabinose/galactoside ABC-type transport system permease subunit